MQVPLALDYFKIGHEGKSYSLVHYWRVLKDLEKWRLTYKAYKKSLRIGKAPATVDLEEEDGEKGTLPRRPRGHKATTNDIKRDAAALALSKTFKGWMANKEEAIAKREEKKHREKKATCNQFLDLTKKAIEVEKSMAKAKIIEAEAKLMAEEREIMLVDTTNMTEDKSLGWRSVVPSSNNVTHDHT
jgi:hypothetical protein